MAWRLTATERIALIRYKALTNRVFLDPTGYNRGLLA
jgi:hypothetical protein